MSAYRLAPAARDLVTAYENDLWDIGQRPDHKVLWGARWFCAHIGEPQAFAELPLEQQLAVNPAVHRFVSCWLPPAGSGPARTTWSYADPGWGSACRGTGRRFTRRS
jgi:hypothetical protein